MDLDLKNVVSFPNGEYAFVSTYSYHDMATYPEYIYKTTIFKCDKDGKVKDWSDYLYYQKYNSKYDATAEHERIVDIASESDSIKGYIYYLN